MVNLLYPSMIAVHRLQTVAGSTDAIGGVGYSGAEQAPAPADPQGELVLFTCVPASIQSGTTGRKRSGASNLPLDALTAPTWYIFTPATALARDSVRDRDFILDDEGYRYEVGQADWQVTGYKLTCIRVEA